MQLGMAQIVGGSLSILVGCGAIGMGVVALVPHKTIARMFGFEGAMIAPFMEQNDIGMTGLFEERKQGGKYTWPAGKPELMDAFRAIPHWIRRRPNALALATAMREFTEETGLPIVAEQLRFLEATGVGKTDTGLPVMLFVMRGCAKSIPGAELQGPQWFTPAGVQQLVKLKAVRKFVVEPATEGGAVFPTIG